MCLRYSRLYSRSNYRAILPLLVLFLTFAILTCSWPTACRASSDPEFSEGILKVKAVKNGKPLRAYCRIFEAGGDEGKKIVAEDWVEKGGVSFNLSPGVYDLIVEDYDEAGTSRVTFPGITVEAGKIVEKVAEFSVGP
jgi:hypothetical protein